jgi:hypothetical protein
VTAAVDEELATALATSPVTELAHPARLAQPLARNRLADLGARRGINGGAERSRVTAVVGTVRGRRLRGRLGEPVERHG